MTMSKIQRLWHIIHYSILEIKKGNFKELKYIANLYFHHVDLKGTSQEELGLSRDRANWSSNSGGPSLERVLDSLEINCRDSIIDIGCGKGGALMTFAKYPFKKICGVELSPHLLRIARDNFVKLGLNDIILYEGDAGNYMNFDEFNYIYMYNPFPCNVMEEVMANLSESLRKVPREMVILYKNPICHEIIVATSLFRQIDMISIESDKGIISIYKSNIEHSN